MAKKKAKTASKKKSKGEVLVVQSKVRDYIKSVGDFNVGSDLMAAVSGRVEDMLADAAKRASDNGRKTIQARDI